jgi:hypothetical protein
MPMTTVSTHEIRLISCIGVEHDLALLPHFLQYYLELGIAPSNMHLVLNAERDGSEELDLARSILDAHGVEPAEVWIAPYTSGMMWEKRRDVQRRVAAPSDWVVSADVDEFHEFPIPLPDFLAYCEREGSNCVQGVFIDRLAPGGRLAKVAQDVPIWDQFPIEADVMCTIRSAEEGKYWYGTVNIMACRGDVLPSRGGHHPLSDEREVSYLLGRPLAEFPGITNPTFRFALPLRVHHFKWTDTLAAGLQRRLSTPGVSKQGSAYGRLLLDYFERNGGIELEDVPIKRRGLADRVPWRARVDALQAGSTALRMARAARGKAGRLKRSVLGRAAI